jgi:DNA-binding GntR family transcriptional regulator
MRPVTIRIWAGGRAAQDLYAELSRSWFGATGFWKEGMQDCDCMQIARSDPAEPLEGGASTRHAYEQLRRMILLGELAPGATFSQVQLSNELGVSRTPLREAVRLLQTERLLDSEPKRRVRVAPLTAEDFEDLYAMRIVLDSLAVRLTVPRLSEPEIADVRLAYLETTATATAGDVAGYREAHRRFHLGLFQHAGPRLRERVQDLWDHAERYRRLHFEQAGEATHLVRLVQRDHAAILEAAQSADADLAARQMAEHLARTALMTLAHTDHRHDPARVRAALEHVYAQDPTAGDLPKAAAS